LGADSPLSNPVTVTGPASPVLSLPATISGGGSGIAGPSLAVAGPSSGAVGVPILPGAMSATLSGSSGPGSSGTIDFTVFGPSATPPSACASGGLDLGTATVSGDGTYNPAAAFAPSQPGNYWLYATYSSDKANKSAAASCPPTAEIVVG
jgi:hypothetical protein